MDKKLFADLVESMSQHNEIIAGTRKPATATKVDAQSIKVLRAKAGLTQEKFAAVIQLYCEPAPKIDQVFARNRRRSWPRGSPTFERHCASVPSH